MNKPKEKLRIGVVCPYGWDTPGGVQTHIKQLAEHLIQDGYRISVDRKSTRLNSSHANISYAVF